ncbi:MAG TPA: XRE family transcriptional regulator, partial [Actinobacteria bacterium]|nr:XRE family transcriptional regulator [Actinomycetota bacterium]
MSKGPKEEGRGVDLGAFIRQQRERANISLRKLADRAGISNPYLSQIER